MGVRPVRTSRKRIERERIELAQKVRGQNHRLAQFAVSGICLDRAPCLWIEKNRFQNLLHLNGICPVRSEDR